jgi:hypothetical protein
MKQMIKSSGSSESGLSQKLFPLPVLLLANATYYNHGIA